MDTACRCHLVTACCRQAGLEASCPSEEVTEVLFARPLYRKVQKGMCPEKTSTLPWARQRPDGISSSFSYTNPQARHSFSVLGTWMPKKDGSTKTINRYQRSPILKTWPNFGTPIVSQTTSDQTEPAEFEITPEARRRYLVAVDREVLARVQRLARMRGVSSESLVNLLLEQRLREVESQAAGA